MAMFADFIFYVFVTRRSDLPHVAPPMNWSAVTPLTRRSALLGLTLGLIAPAAAQTRAPSARADRVEKNLPDFERIVAQTMRKLDIPGVAFAVVSRDHVVYLNGFGARRAGGAEPVDADTVFALASLSKPLATALCPLMTRWSVKNRISRGATRG